MHFPPCQKIRVSNANADAAGEFACAVRASCSGMRTDAADAVLELQDVRGRGDIVRRPQYLVFEERRWCGNRGSRAASSEAAIRGRNGTAKRFAMRSTAAMPSLRREGEPPVRCCRSFVLHDSAENAPGAGWFPATFTFGYLTMHSLRTGLTPPE